MGGADDGPVRLRRAGAADVAFLGRVLMDAAFRPGLARPSVEEALADPALGHYIDGWPRAGDHGVVAEATVGDAGDADGVGGAWFRYFPAGEAGYGFVDDATPELSIAVRDGWRGRGIGRLLLVRLLTDAAELGIPRLSLSVSLENEAALRLYRSLGFAQVGVPEGGSITMVAPSNRC